MKKSLGESTPEDLKNLKEFILKNHNRYTSVFNAHAENIEQFILSVIKLDVSYRELTSLPETIGELVNLKLLNVSGNELTSLPETIGELVNLIELNVRGNELTSLPETIGELTNLEYLIVGENQLTSLPETIGKLSLRKLDVSYNLLEELPDIRARHLHIDGNPVDKYRKNREKFKAHLENIGDKVNKLKMSDDNRELQKMAICDRQRAIAN
jgi:Leucine-rich repeat (LRR) protein